MINKLKDYFKYFTYSSTVSRLTLTKSIVIKMKSSKNPMAAIPHAM